MSRLLHFICSFYEIKRLFFFFCCCCCREHGTMLLIAKLTLGEAKSTDFRKVLSYKIKTNNKKQTPVTLVRLNRRSGVPRGANAEPNEVSAAIQRSKKTLALCHLAIFFTQLKKKKEYKSLNN